VGGSFAPGGPPKPEKNSEPVGKSLDPGGKRGKEVAGLTCIVVYL
jgi:hypothetical protein